MSQEPKNPTQDKSSQPAGRGAKREVELFPAVVDKKSTLTPVATGGGTRQGVQISLFTPVNFEEAVEIVDCLQSRGATTISLDKMKKPDASRLIDFVRGASTALDGDFHQLTEQVFIFCPSNIKIVAPTKAPAIKSGAGALDYLFSDWKTGSSSSPGVGRS